jgi:hypothetical protein
MGKKSFTFMLIFSIAIFIILPVLIFATPVPDTGQTKCYDNTHEIPCPQPGEPFYGQDAQYGQNSQSFTELGNGVVRDNVTGLEWQQETAPDFYNWSDANNYCENLTFGGYNDWRLPTIKELSTLLDLSIYYPGPTINTSFFPDTEAAVYWSSTTSASSLYNAWSVYLFDGNIGGGGKNSGGYVRAVRGEESFNNFINNGDGTVTDTSTGLMWQQSTAPGNYTWEQAFAYCENLTISGFSDWRLPNRNELQSIVDYSRYNPAIDTNFFPITEPYSYWSSTPYAGNSSLAWELYFEYGYGNYYYKTSYNYVRAVRTTILHVGLDKPYNTIQSAIDAAQDGDTVLVHDGTYVENINFQGKKITVKSENGASNTIIDGNQNGDVVTFNDLSNSIKGSAVLDGFTVKNGSSRGIFSCYISATVTNCSISGNEGGGIYLWGAYMGKMTITDCIITENGNDGIFLRQATATINNCIISGNVGSGFFNGGDSSWTIIDSIISGNTGSGIGSNSYSSGDITNCIISGNSESGISGVGTPISVTNCTITGNTAGGISYYYSVQIIIKNTILWGNSATVGWNELYPDEYTTIAVTYSDVAGGWEGTGNINADPLFMDAAGGDYHLSAESPCIDAGTCDYAPVSDKEGTLRPQGVGCDIGAYEYVFTDNDEDGIPDSEDNCPNKPNGPLFGTCMPGSDKAGATCHSDADCVIGCSTSGKCSLNQEDTDKDGVGDVCDNCPAVCNPQQLDANGNGKGDLCDPAPGCGGCSGVECEPVCEI